MKRDESVYLRRILDAIAKVESYLQKIFLASNRQLPNS